MRGVNYTHANGNDLEAVRTRVQRMAQSFLGETRNVVTDLYERAVCGSAEAPARAEESGGLCVCTGSSGQKRVSITGKNNIESRGIG